MKLREVLALVAVAAIAACGGGAEEPAVDTASGAAPEEAPMDDAAAIARPGDDGNLQIQWTTSNRLSVDR